MIESKDIVIIKLNSVKDEIDFATMTADLKSKKDFTANTWQKERSEFRKFTDLFPGDLAKNIVRVKAKEIGINLIDYDKIRTDNFKYNDTYDLKYDTKLIEVKSSIEKYSNSISVLINSRRFIIYPGREIAYLIFQVFYIFQNHIGKLFFTDMEKISDSVFLSKYNINSKEEFVNKFITFAPEAHIMGFITQEMAEKRKNDIFIYSNTSVTGDRRRNYIDFFISQGIPFSDFPKYL